MPGQTQRRAHSGAGSQGTRSHAWTPAVLGGSRAHPAPYPAPSAGQRHTPQTPGEGHSRSSIPVIRQEILLACTTCSPAASRVSSYLSFCSAPLKIVLPQVLFLSKARRFSPGPTQGTKCKEPPPCPLFTCLVPVFSCACSGRDNIR